MIRNYKNSILLDSTTIKIKKTNKFINFCINYEKGSEKGMEISFLLKINELPNLYKFYKNNELVKIYFKDSDCRSTTIEFPSFCEEIICKVNYLGNPNEYSAVDIFPLF